MTEHKKPMAEANRDIEHFIKNNDGLNQIAGLLQFMESHIHQVIAELQMAFNGQVDGVLQN